MSASDPIVWTDPARRAAFDLWLHDQCGAHSLDRTSLRAASADASFRRYFRIDRMPRDPHLPRDSRLPRLPHEPLDARGAVNALDAVNTVSTLDASDASDTRTADAPTRIVMDAPPQHEDCRPFVRIAALLRGGGVRAPEVLAWDEAAGFMLLEDLGPTTLLDALAGHDAAGAAPLYRAALDGLITLQRIAPPPSVLPYDEALLRRELDLFVPWYAERHCGLALTSGERDSLARCERLILDACTAQPRVLVHRDYHARNLLQPVRPGAAPGVIDFQDAVLGPVTYDLVSLLRDAYVDWDEEVQLDWAIRYWERARRAGVPLHADFGEFWRAFEWMGLQRHLKVLGIFARLQHRDGKSAYVADMPRVWRHAHHVAARYQGLGPLALLLERLAGTQRQSGYTF